MKGTHKPSLVHSRAMDSVNVASDDGMTREALEQADREVEAEIAANRARAEAVVAARRRDDACEDCGCPLDMHHTDRGDGFNDLGSGERVCPSKERRYEYRKERAEE